MKTAAALLNVPTQALATWHSQQSNAGRKPDRHEHAEPSVARGQKRARREAHLAVHADSGAGRGRGGQGNRGARGGLFESRRLEADEARDAPSTPPRTDLLGSRRCKRKPSAPCAALFCVLS